MGNARTRGPAPPATSGASSYRATRALIALLVALLALFCVVIVEQTPLAVALRVARRNPPAMNTSAALALGAAVLIPVCGGALAYLLTGLAVPLLRVGLYSRRLHQAVARQMSYAPLVAVGPELRAVQFAADGQRGERIALSQALAGPTSLLFVGEAGTGKTTALALLVLGATRRRHLLALCFGRPLPVLLSLADLMAAENGAVPLAELVRRAAAPFATRGLLTTLPDRLRTGRLALYCDELETLPTPRRAMLCDALAAFMTAGGTLVATCRLDIYTGQPTAFSALEHLPRTVLEGADAGAVALALRRARPAGGGTWRETELLDLLRAHQLDLWAALPAHLAELHTLTHAADGRPLPFGRAQAAARYLEVVAGRASAAEDLSRTLGALASSLLLARQSALPLPRDLPLGAALERWLATFPPLPHTDPATAALSADRLDTAARDALDVGVLHLAADGAALRFVHSVLQAQWAAYALAREDDGFGWPAPDLLGEDWVMPVILWSGLRDEPIDVTRRLLHLADTPDTTAMRAGMTLRADVAPAVFALAIAALTDALAARLAEAAGTERERAVTAQAEHQLRDLLDRVQVMLADSSNIQRLASALRQVERRAGPELTEAFGFLVAHAPLSRLLRGQIATLLGLLATPRALEMVTALLADTDPLTHQAIAQAVAWAGAPAIIALQRALTAPDERVRTRAAELLARFGPGAEEGAIAALRAANPTRRLVATRTLASVAAASAQAEEALIERLADPDADVRRAAVGALGQLDTPGALAALTHVLVDPDPQLRTAVAEALGTSGADGALAGLLHLLGDDEPQVRATAVAALGTLADERALEAIETRRDDPDPWVRNAVAQARRRLGRE